MLTQFDYKSRHDDVARVLHEKLAPKYSLMNDSTLYCKDSPSKVLENNVARSCWDRATLDPYLP
jgi:hypothetical protein